MSQLMEARVPDIGSDKGVPVIELLVKVGDTVAKDQGLVTLESDKATMEVPAPFAGVVRELRVKVGDEINTGAIVAMIEAAEAAAAPAAKAPAPTPPAASKTAEPTSGAGAKASPSHRPRHPRRPARRAAAQPRSAPATAAAARPRPSLGPARFGPRHAISAATCSCRACFPMPARWCACSPASWAWILRR
jgi:pyruvate dehydrogenase E2 component (dihydrolipoamide acetyltransferase)